MITPVMGRRWAVWLAALLLVGAVRAEVFAFVTAERVAPIVVAAGEPEFVRLAAEDLLNQLRQYGIFVIPGGELESWMKSLGATGHGPGWLIDMFERMGEDPSNANYVRPNTNDVWEFVCDIKSWLVDPARKGIPA